MKYRVFGKTGWNVSEVGLGTWQVGGGWGKPFDLKKAEAINATNEAGLSANTESPKTTKAGKFAIHSLQMRCSKADLASVLRFYESVKSRAPYLAIGNLSMTAERGTAGTVTFKATITALELLGELPAGVKAAEPEEGK